MNIKKVFVMGAGLMGTGIAQVCAQAGYDVAMCDISQEALDKAMKNITWSVGKFVEKGKLKEPVDTVTSRIKPTLNPEDAKDADIAIEAVFEKVDLKKEIFKKLDATLPEHALIASNTSAIPITTLAAVTNRHDRVLGLHFFSPVPMMQAVEVVRAITTSDETFETGKQFVISLGKEPILVKKDIPGFIINRINFPSTMEAMRLVEAGVATVEDIDKGLRLAAGRKMGIFETGDMVGLDVTYGALMAIYEETKDPRWYPPEILRRKVTLGHLGKKTGRGWYVYDENGNRIGPADS
ncbi:MAG: 3-hydroxyacyl-CoA dehydrogenase family protein [Deltaproteobacteria bacterium]|nr:3-hydroxyacyl-CoA dehydrogenase family protein [Deltaproteobacteria bacterium]MBW2068560.1 3-hydroxyacyl-CoA dehydrogenase family protein [Deltaproteobacteria bacterium]